jgi:hypothetical protein
MGRHFYNFLPLRISVGVARTVSHSHVSVPLNNFADLCVMCQDSDVFVRNTNSAGGIQKRRLSGRALAKQWVQYLLKNIRDKDIQMCCGSISMRLQGVAGLAAEQ